MRIVNNPPKFSSRKMPKTLPGKVLFYVKRVFVDELKGDMSGINARVWRMKARRQSGVNFSVLESSAEKDQNGMAFSSRNIAETQKGVFVGIGNFARSQQGLFLTLAGNGTIIEQRGFFLGLLFNYSKAMHGIGIAIYDLIDEMHGLAVGAINRFNQSLTGVSLSLFAKAGKFKGVIIGLATKVERSGNSKGVQIGLINVRADQENPFLKYIPLIAISTGKSEPKKGTHGQSHLRLIE